MLEPMDQFKRKEKSKKEIFSKWEFALKESYKNAFANPVTEPFETIFEARSESQLSALRAFLDELLLFGYTKTLQVRFSKRKKLRGVAVFCTFAQFDSACQGDLFHLYQSKK